MSDLRSLLEDQIKDIYSAEKQVSRALPKLAQAAQDKKLVKAFEDHLEETRGQIKRIEQIGAFMEIEVTGEKCDAAEGLIKESESVIEDHDAGPTRDAGLITAAQRFEHYEIAAYGSAREFARQLGLEEVAQLLQETLDEESHANELLNQIALDRVNMKAAGGSNGKSQEPQTDLENMTREQLYELAQEQDITGRSSMTKKELVQALS